MENDKIARPAQRRAGEGWPLVARRLLTRREVSADGRAVLGKLHALSACLLFVAWPFTRLVHVWSAPIGYLARPHLVYRRRATPAAAPTAVRRPRPASGSRRAA
ncbi:respiratory nitrate reductase subunit gamma [Streptomyces sp. CA-142005]|uniref:respiratory nitrate reductase subunit gamma n=1 Tax=Streptomyces sp. CA-142005 TaxID=3240052 RepID=UPI003D9361D0